MAENRMLPASIGTGIVVTYLVALFVTNTVDLWALIAGPLVFVYFAWRLVMALEKIASAIEESG